MMHLFFQYLYDLNLLYRMNNHLYFQLHLVLFFLFLLYFLLNYYYLFLYYLFFALFLFLHLVLIDIYQIYNLKNWLDFHKINQNIYLFYLNNFQSKLAPYLLQSIFYKNLFYVLYHLYLFLK